jgi:glutaminyl-tRNA synthetase
METEVNELISLFGRIGIDEKKASETVKNKKLTTALKSLIEESGCKEVGCERSAGLLLYLLASICTPGAQKHRLFIARKIIIRDLKADAQVQAAVKFCDDLKRHQNGNDDSIDEAAFDAFCGVNVVVTQAHVIDATAQVMESHREGLLKDRYLYNFGLVLKSLKDREDMRWADRKFMKDSVDAAILALLGPKTAEDDEALAKSKKKPEKEVAASTEQKGSSDRTFTGEVLKFHKPGENKQLNDEIMRRHLEATGGRVVTRFPPEPNGFLHIGHAKAINFNFGYAKAHGGITYLRYDDTNPEAEEERYYEAIKENVEWLGFEPYKITYASDYFDQLYLYAIELIKKGMAYVCHMTAEEIRASRGGDEKGPRYDSPYRNRPVEENLREFEKMKNGEYEEGRAILRLKQDMQSGNPCMWDLVAYRIDKTNAHHRTGRKWCIYPMYDFTHCLCDSLENITHSLCTTEFILAREAYYWVCDQVGVYKAVQWEYGRLNLTNTILSKRKLTKLVEEGVVSSWDDPRLYTLAAVRRRGFTPAAINRFCEEIGITTAPTVVDNRKLESFVRDDLNKITLRRMCVLEPLLVEIVNVPTDFKRTITLPNDPRDPVKGESTIELTNQVYMDACDFRFEESSDASFFRLTPKQTVGLYRVGVMSFVKADVDPETGKPVKIYVELDQAEVPEVKPKTYIQWVPKETALPAEIRIFSDLFKSVNPQANPEGWLADVNRDSLRVVSDALVDSRLSTAQVEDKFQFQRVGYFCVDPDTRTSGNGKLVLNLTVSIKEDPNKN